MKLFSIFNNPAIKTDNKQSGLVFMQWAILVFIAGFAMICVVWWFYYVLQGKVIVVKGEIEHMRDTIIERPACRLPHPGMEQEANGNGEIGPIEHAADGTWYWIYDIPFSNQNITICNLNPLGGSNLTGIVNFFQHFAYIGQRYFSYTYPPPPNAGPLAPQDCITFPFSHTPPGLYQIKFVVAGGGNYSITVSEQ